MVGDPSWAASLAGKTISTALGERKPPSLFSRLSSGGTSLSMAGAAEVSLPFLASDDPVGGWIAELQPIPSAQLSGAGLILKPKKLGVLCSFTYELRQRAISDIETVLGSVLLDDAAILADRALVDDQPASAARPQGLRFLVRRR